MGLIVEDGDSRWWSARLRQVKSPASSPAESALYASSSACKAGRWTGSEAMEAGTGGQTKAGGMWEQSLAQQSLLLSISWRRELAAGPTATPAYTQANSTVDLILTTKHTIYCIVFLQVCQNPPAVSEFVTYALNIFWHSDASDFRTVFFKCYSDQQH